MNKSGKRPSLRTKMMGINIGITLASFILCGFLFVMAVYFLVGKYVNHDFDFFLTEVSENLNSKLDYLEEVIYDVRGSQNTMNYLQGAPDTGGEGVLEEFKETVDISHAKNQGSEGNPVVEKIYLFREDGQFLSDFYYAMIYSEIKASDSTFHQVWKDYQQKCRDTKGFQSYCYIQGEKAYMSYSVLDDGMGQKGVLIFEVNLKTIQSVMNTMKSYDNAFWIMYNESGVIASINAEKAREGIEQFKVKQNARPYIDKIGDSEYRVYSKKMCLNMAVTVGIPEYQAMVMLYNSSYIYIIGIIMILLAGVFSFGMFTHKVTKPIGEVTERLLQVQKGNYETKLPDYDSQEFYEISQVFNQMTDHIHHLINQVYEKQISIKEMELKFLQTQMNPHFMFNVLNAIALQAKIDGNEEICMQISTFSRLIQAKIYRSDSEKIQVRQELEYVKYYLGIQKFRYGERLSYAIEIEQEELLDLYIPKLCIQMLAENAVVHGLEPKMSDGNVKITVGSNEDLLTVEIEDDGVGFNMEGLIELPLKIKVADASHNHVGLNNVHHIIQLMYGKEYGITVYSEKNNGTKAKITIPFDTGV